MLAMVCAFFGRVGEFYVLLCIGFKSWCQLMSALGYSPHGRTSPSLISDAFVFLFV